MSHGSSPDEDDATAPDRPRPPHRARDAARRSNPARAENSRPDLARRTPDSSRGRSRPGGSGRSEREDRPPATGVTSGPRRAPRENLPIPDDVTGRELDGDVRRQLRTLPTDLATKVGRHLVMAGRLLDEDPDTAYRHAVEARRLASRVAAVREAAGLSAYAAGRYAEALTELRAATRMSGRPDLLPLIADAERGVGRPERALALAASDEARTLPVDGRVELAIVASGARRDIGQPDAAVVALQIPELRSGQREPWFARLAYAYAEALEVVGRSAEAMTWLRRAADADGDGVTGAAERWEELHGVTLVEEADS
jgi:tetratricopeptide (TPR) repeat protein